MQLGGALDVVHAELLPQDKATIIKEIQKESKTAMVGDGLNDAPALATADIGISMGVSGSALANETGHVILMSNDIRKIPVAVRLARKTRRKIFENIFIAVITKAAIIALAIAGHPLVWAAVLADVGTCLLVIFNSMLLLQGVSSKTTQHHHSGSSLNHAHCSSGSKIQNKCSDVGKKHGGCCDHDDNSQELKHLVKETKENDTCCGHDDDHVEDDCCVVDDHDHEVKHCIPEATDKCCGHDAHEAKQVVQQPEQEKEKHGCCTHEDDDEIHEIKQVVHTHVTKDLESQKQSQCSHNEATHEKSHCHTSLKTKADDDHIGHHHHHHHHHHEVKEYITSEQLGKAVSSCCKNHGLKKRHISGCCKSFVYKCGGGFNKKGYLSEIVIE